MTERSAPPSGSLLFHLTELRTCLIRSLIALIVGFGICAYFSRKLYEILATPLMHVLPSNSHFIATQPLEGWLTYLKTALIGGLFLALPFIFWQVWWFVAPGLYKKEKRWALIFVFVTSCLFVAGAVFGYFLVFPAAFKFFAGIFDNTGIVFLPQMKDYLGLAFLMLMAFGLIFETPLIVFVVAVTGLVPIATLMRTQKYMLVGAFVMAAIITPGPDPVSQVIMAVPLILLYEIGLFCAWLVKRKRK